MQSLFNKYPFKYVIIWYLILFLLLFSIVLFILIFIHRTTQDKQEKIFKFRQRKIENLLTHLIIENELNPNEIINSFQNAITKKLLKNKQFNFQVLATAVSLFDKMQGSAQDTILKIIDTLQLKQIIYKNIKRKSRIKKMIGLNALQILNLNENELKIKSKNKNIVNKYNEILFSKITSLKNNLIFNDWQKSYILYFLQRNQTAGLPDFSKLLDSTNNIETQQFAVELIYYFGQIEYNDLLLNKLENIDFEDSKNNSLIFALISASLYFDELACKKILREKLYTSNSEIYGYINNMLINTNIA